MHPNVTLSVHRPLSEPQAESDGYCETSVHKVNGPSEKPLTVTLEIDRVQVLMEIDTGAAVSLISEETQKHLFPKGSLRQPEVCLKTYTSESIPVIGVLRVQVKYRGYLGSHDLYVVSGNGPALLGRDWLQFVRLDWHSLGVVYVGERSLTLNDVIGEQS